MDVLATKNNKGKDIPRLDTESTESYNRYTVPRATGDRLTIQQRCLHPHSGLASSYKDHHLLNIANCDGPVDISKALSALLCAGIVLSCR